MNIVKLGLFIIVCLGQCHEMIFTQRMKFTSLSITEQTVITEQTTEKSYLFVLIIYRKPPN
jgi:hypothetical protein